MNNIINKTLLSIYGIMLLLIGVLLVPYHIVGGRGNEITISDAKYAPIWKLMNGRDEINGFHPIYELQIQRLLYEILILTLIFLVLYLLLKKHEK
ncbi:hypothetical protein Back11_54690 [Paenibacillus baekrokdamisoli]|uniref:Uncharacterized protein n=1 Tax=Paenibacillus baekrokdamisoli TaxID=1712516 RepID=A0A3G9JMM5_9BACL|nr:hypothetical protein [Paenibacillus baekrokdamisoli]MBB3071893.1 flagellar biosynthesis protein FlhB [Paenibacillus baekrokdamisoli]BBH24124.1 hypothetical protein Back11_54690 [Paenibacillus baekrokdamisoli]